MSDQLDAFSHLWQGEEGEYVILSKEDDELTIGSRCIIYNISNSSVVLIDDDELAPGATVKNLIEGATGCLPASAGHGIHSSSILHRASSQNSAGQSSTMGNASSRNRPSSVYHLQLDQRQSLTVHSQTFQQWAGILPRARQSPDWPSGPVGNTSKWTCCRHVHRRNQTKTMPLDSPIDTDAEHCSPHVVGQQRHSTVA